MPGTQSSGSETTEKVLMAIAILTFLGYVAIFNM